MGIKKHVPCSSPCLRCGTCCIVLCVHDLDGKFYKSAYTKCPHLCYEDKKTSCKLFGENGRPRSCQVFSSDHGAQRVVLESRMKSFSYPDMTEHFIWLYKNNLLDHFDTIKDIKKCKYEHIELFFSFFIHPYICNVPGSVAARDDWFHLWNLRDYFFNMPLSIEIKLAELAKKVCLKLYNNTMPQQVERLLKSVEKYPQGKWLKMLKCMNWLS